MPRLSMRHTATAVLCLAAILASCSGPSKTSSSQPAPVAKPKLGIRPTGDETIQPDLSKTPRISRRSTPTSTSTSMNTWKICRNGFASRASPTAVKAFPESAEMVKGFFDQLGCQQTRVYDVGVTEYGSPGNPVVYANCDEGAPQNARHLLDVRHHAHHPARRLESPPFEARLVEQPPFQEGSDRARRRQLQRSGNGRVECHLLNEEQSSASCP